MIYFSLFLLIIAISSFTKLSQKRNVWVNRDTETHLAVQRSTQDFTKKSIFRVMFEYLEGFYSHWYYSSFTKIRRFGITRWYNKREGIQWYKNYEPFPDKGKRNLVSLIQMNQFENIKKPKITCPNSFGDLQKWQLFYTCI